MSEVPKHVYVIRKLNTRNEDKNFVIDEISVGEECNRLAIYLAQFRASNWDMMVLLEESFGRVNGLWYNDMGLGQVGPQFEIIRERDITDGVVPNDVEVLGDDIMN